MDILSSNVARNGLIPVHQLLAVKGKGVVAYGDLSGNVHADIG